MKRIFSIALLLGIVSVFFTSCGDKFVYQNTLEFPDQKWDRIEKGKDISFEKINITNIKDVYDINVSFSHTKNINVDEISFILRIISPSGIKKETIHTVQLKDRNAEKFIGSDLGNTVEIKEPIKQYLTFTEKGEYKFIISNYSSKYQVTGLKNIGIEVKKSELDYNVEK